MFTGAGEYFIHNYTYGCTSYAGKPEEAFRRCCMTGIMTNTLRMNIDKRRDENETNSKEIDEGR